MTVANATGKIVVLPPAVVTQIAAGEVIERPASVVKELVDNSLDAGSSRVTVEVADGGRALIRVTDNGEGMARADAQLAFERHATSKLRTEGDLWSIRTLGFRGEALPSIAAVAKLRVRTVPAGDRVGTQLVLTGGRVTKLEDVAAAQGTQIEVSELFFNTPARKKFLKTPSTEFSHICQVLQQASLVWPGVHFVLLRNDQDVFQYPPAGSLRNRVLQVYGSKLAQQVLDVQGEQFGVRVSGVVIDPVHARSSRAPQELFVNRRPVRNPTVAHAVYDAYGGALARGRHPQFILFLEVDTRQVDVNVHPTKREIRFANQDLIHQAVRRSVREALKKMTPTGPAPIPAGFSEGEGGEAQVRHFTEFGPVLAEEGGTRPESAPSPGSGGPSRAEGTGHPFSREAGQPYLLQADRPVLALGQVHHMYLVAQIGPELHIVDQHTAHERVLFERLTRAWTTQQVVVQPLLIPEPVELPPHAAGGVERHLADLEKLGIVLEPFGAGTFLIRAMPALLSRLDYGALVQDLVDDLSQWNTTSSLETRVRPVLASLACHGAVRAGRAMELPEMTQLLKEWVEEGLPSTCPHGRRVALRFSADELHKIFGRV